MKFSFSLQVLLSYVFLEFLHCYIYAMQVSLFCPFLFTVAISMLSIECNILWIELPRPEIHRTPTHDIREHWIAVSTLLGLISSVYPNLHHWRSNQRPQFAVPKLYNWAMSLYRTQVTPNQLVIVIARPNNLNVFCKLHPYSFQRTRSPPGPRLPKKLRSTHPRNYYTPGARE